MFTCEILSTLPGINHGFFGREGGVSTGQYASLNCGYGSGDDIKLVGQNRAIVAEKLGVESPQLCTAYQIHSAKAVTLSEPWHWKEAPEADALVTATPGVAISILTADCLPILFADSKNRVIGAAHAGWKGAFSGIIESTLSAMLTLGASRSSICATIGPAIAQESYEVDEAYRQRFIDQNAAHYTYFKPAKRPEHFFFDLKGYAASRLRGAGLTRINVLAQDTCFGENAHFSYRRATLRGESVYGRQISAIVLDENYVTDPFRRPRRLHMDGR